MKSNESKRHTSLIVSKLLWSVFISISISIYFVQKHITATQSRPTRVNRQTLKTPRSTQYTDKLHVKLFSVVCSVDGA